MADGAARTSTEHGWIQTAWDCVGRYHPLRPLKVHIDAAILGRRQASAAGDLAQRGLPGKTVKGKAVRWISFTPAHR